MNQTFELHLSGTPVPHRYRVRVPGSNGEEPIEDFFELRSDSVELTLTLAALAKAASSGEKPEQDLHLEFGQRLFRLVFGGAVGACWQERRKAVGRNPLALVLRVDPQTARFLLRIPWEYLHDGKDFLATDWRTPVYRLPANIEPLDFEPLKEPLRMLVVIAAPLGLNENEVLHFSREEDLILAATAQARKAGKLRLEFTPNGAPETVEQYLREYQPHLLHFVGHGVFVDSADSGLLLMETPEGHRREVWNKDFAGLLVKNGRELRGVFLSACQSAVAPRADGFADLASRLLEEGIPVVTAMQHSVLNVSAMAFGSTFYKGIADGRFVEDAFTDARQALKTSSPNNVDFATPVLFLSDPDCLRVDLPQAGRASAAPLDLSGLTKAQSFVGRAAEIRELQTHLDPQNGTWRAAVIHAIGGMGKTVLAARLAERMAPRLDGAISLRMSPSVTAQNVLDHIGDFLFAHNAQLDRSEIHEYQQRRSQPMEPGVRVGMLAQILRTLRLLVIFDNCEDILPRGREVSRAAAAGPSASLDPELLPLIAALVGSVDGPTRFLFTSRVDFSPVEENRLADAIGHLPLKEMGFRETVYLMETLPPLNSLPVAILNEARADSAPSPQPIAMRDVYARLGGHPYRLNLFARHAARTSIRQVLDDLSGVQQELLEFTLLEKAVEQLPERAALLVRRGVVFEGPVPIEGLAFLLGDGQDAMPDVTAELEALLQWGLAAREPGTEDYSLHSVVRDWAKRTWTETETKEYLRRAARYWRGVAGDSRSLWDFLRARHYLFEAGDYEQADDIVQAAYNFLLRWGHLGLLLSLLRQSTDTLQGNSKAVALGNLATIYMSLGDYGTASKYYQQVLPLFDGLEHRQQRATVLHQIGMLHQQQGDYPRALEFYQRSLKIDEEIGDRAGVSRSLHQIGMLHQQQGEYPRALEFCQQSLKILEEIGDRAGVASSLSQIGIVIQQQGNYREALDYQRRSLAIREEIGDRKGVSICLHQIGNLHYLQGDYPRALEFYQRSLKIDEEIGDRAGVSRSLHQIGMLHQQQGEYPRALEFYQQSLKIEEEIGDRAGVAISLGQLGLLYEQTDQTGQAIAALGKAFVLFAAMGMPQAKLARDALRRLRSNAGGEAFLAAIQAIGLPAEMHSALLQALENSEGQSGSEEPDLRTLLTRNTIAVLTGVPDKKGEWGEALRDLERQAGEQGEQALSRYARALLRLVEGARPDALTSDIPDEFKPDWQAILDGISGKE